MIELNFSGKDVVVVGGSSGIGNAVAQLFHVAGARVTVTGTRPNPDDYGPDSRLDAFAYHQVDTADRASIEAFTSCVEDIDVLVNAAGTVMYARQEFEIANFERVIAANLTGIMQLCTSFRARLARAGGSIVNIGSVASFRGVVGTPAYSASKGGLLTLTKTFAQAFAVDGIRVNLVAPGYVPTKMTEVMWSSPKRRESVLGSIPLQRFGKPEEIAGAVLFLASPLASYVTGESILVDGGLSA